MALKIKNGKVEYKVIKSDKLVGLKYEDLGGRQAQERNYISKKLHKNLGGFEVVALEDSPEGTDKQLDEVRKKPEVAIGTHIYHAEGSNRPIVPTGIIIIEFNEGTSAEEQQLALDEFHLELVDRRSVLLCIARVTPQSPNPIKVANYLQDSLLVKVAEPDIDTVLDQYDFAAPQDNLLKHQWYFRNTGKIIDADYFRIKKSADARILDAWERLGSMGSSDITIAVIDSGFDLSHPDLRDKVYKPFDYWNQTSVLEEGNPDYTHGTPCASVALAASNGRGIVGAAPNARFMPFNGLSYSLQATEQMFNYCIRHGADIISCSWGTTELQYNLNTLKEKAITKAAKEGRNGKGCVILYATGNEDLDYVNFYSAHPDVIAVGACNSSDEHSSYSNRGKEISVVAPSDGGWPVIAARAWWDNGIDGRIGQQRYWADGVDRGQHYKHFGGTSSATPLVAGICALMLSANPGLTAREVKDILQRTADKIGNPAEYDARGHSRRYGYGRVNALKAVGEALRLKEGVAPVEPEVEGSVRSGQGLFRFSVQHQPSTGFGVQVGAFAEYGNVLIRAEKYERMFGEPIIVNINELDGRTVYKVVVGAYADKRDARQLLKRIKDAGISAFLRNLEDLK